MLKMNLGILSTFSQSTVEIRLLKIGKKYILFHPDSQRFRGSQIIGSQRAAYAIKGRSLIFNVINPKFVINSLRVSLNCLSFVN